MKVPAMVFRLARANARMLLASAGTGGTPHLDGAGGLSCLAAGRVGVRYWFCPRTLANLEENPRCSLVIWSAEEDDGGPAAPGGALPDHPGRSGAGFPQHPSLGCADRARRA